MGARHLQHAHMGLVRNVAKKVLARDIYPLPHFAHQALSPAQAVLGIISLGCLARAPSHGEHPGRHYVLISPHQGPRCYTFLSKRWLEMTGLDPVKLKEDISHYFSIVHPEDREEAIAHNIAGAAALKPYKWEGRWLRDGKLTWVSIESVPRKTATGEVVWEGVFIDITALKEAEAQLLAAKEEFYRIINHLPIPVASILHTPGQPVNFINNAFTETYGWTIEDCPTMADWARCAYPDEKYRKAVFDEFDAEVSASVRENRPFDR